jgi:predicted ATPase
MIRRLLVSNFKSLGKVAIPLGRLTALVGPNGAGKSNVVDALQFLSDCMHLGLEGAVTKRHGITAVRRWSSGHPYNVTLGIELEGKAVRAQYGFELAGDRTEAYRVKREHARVEANGQAHTFEINNGEWSSSVAVLRPKVDQMGLVLPLIAGDERFRPLADHIRGIASYSIFPDSLREPQKYDPARPMHRYGANWISILKDQEESDWKPDLVQVLSRLSGGEITDIQTQAVSSYLAVRFEHRRENGSKKAKWFDAAQESDGTLRVAGIVTALRQKPLPTLVAVEEPELTVHPGALNLIYDYLQEAADSTQVVLTTHSPDLLNLLRSDEVLIVERVHGVTEVAQIASDQKQAVADKLLSLGDIHRTVGLRGEQLDLDLPEIEG